ncbi:hypothetical protein ACT2CV_07610 [Pasteurellaceae bacterium 22721_9_1]
MISWKKGFMGFLMVLLLITLILCAAVFFIFDAKDTCLDYGGSYNEITQQCEK